MTDTLVSLHEKHSALCARAHELGIKLTDDLTVDFDDEEAGTELCRCIEDLIGVAEVAESGDTAPKAKKTRQKKKVAKVAAPITEEKKVPTAKAKKATAKTASKKKAQTNARSGNSKVSKVISLMKRAGGVTREEVLKVTGWKAVSMQQVAKGAGVKLKVDDSERPYKYKAA